MLTKNKLYKTSLIDKSTERIIENHCFAKYTRDSPLLAWS